MLAQRGRYLFRRINFVNGQLYVDMIVTPDIKKGMFFNCEERCFVIVKSSVWERSYASVF